MLYDASNFVSLVSQPLERLSRIPTCPLDDICLVDGSEAEDMTSAQQMSNLDVQSDNFNASGTNASLMASIACAYASPNKTRIGLLRPKAKVHIFSTVSATLMEAFPKTKKAGRVDVGLKHV
uniref:Uncharacterized protein n=1 Tax=Opuntia streptacantha TaxID=393608 RepID=A0A7C9EGM4_OPUST